MLHLNHIPRRYRVGMVGWFSLCLAALIAVGLLIFWVFLMDYQQSLPQNLASQILVAYQSGDAKTIQEYSVNLPRALEKPETFARYYNQYAALDQLYFYQGASDAPEVLCYELATGNDLVATLELEQAGEKSRFGFLRYKIKSITGHPLVRYQITAPRDTLLFSDGLLLSERYLIGEQPVTDGFSELTGAVSFVKSYEITDFAFVGELEAVGLDGSKCVVTWDDTHRTATVEKRVSEEEKAEIADFARNFAQAYSVFATKRNGTRAPVVRMLYPETAFYKSLLLYTNDWGESYVSDRFDNQSIDEFKRHSPTDFSCRIRFDYVITLRDGFEKTYPYDMTYYLTNRSGRLLLVDMQPQSS